MVDIAAFEALRAVRRAQPGPEATLATQWEQPQEGKEGVPHVWGGGEFIEQLLAIVNNADAPAAIDLARAHLATQGAITIAALRGGPDPALAYAADDATIHPVPGQRGLILVERLDRWLVGEDNRPTSTALEAWIAVNLREVAPGYFDGREADQAPGGSPLEWTARLFGLLSPTWKRLVDTVAAAVLVPEAAETAQRVNRLLLVAGLLVDRSMRRRPLKRGLTWRLLAHRTVLLPSPPFPDILSPDRIQLVRRATTSDLFVVRREWRGYLAGEVAEIRNVMAGETLGQDVKVISEAEVTEISATQTDTSSESSTESTEESSFSEEVRRDIALKIGADAQADVHVDYGIATLDVSAGFSADFSLEDSTRRATEIAKKAVARAASKTARSVRSSRTRRTLERTERDDSHAFAADATGHRVGVYRWLQRVDRFQVWRYPARFQLEFQIPVPGTLLWRRLSQPRTDPAAIPAPPPFELPPGGITRDNYLALAATFHASGLVEPPDRTCGVSVTIPLDGQETINSDAPVWNPATLTAEREVAIPPGYAATSAAVSVNATPVHAFWRREFFTHVGWEVLEGYHTIVAEVALGGTVVRHTQVGPGPGNRNAVQSTGRETVQIQYLDALLQSPTTGTSFTPPLALKAPIAVSLTGAASGAVAIEFSCTLTAEAEAAWQRSVYEALAAGHQDWTRTWRAQQAALGAPLALAERSPARHEAMIRDELRRHVIAWLLGEAPFLGRHGTLDRPIRFPTPRDDVPLGLSSDVDVEAAIAQAPAIQFLEQCLEWSNLSWVLYPYYWADREDWGAMLDLETVDPALGEFLRAGSARVVVPARPGFSAAVIHWLTFGQPWLGGGAAPVPGDELFVSVAQEIQDQLKPPADGEPGESWEVALPTSLVWLDPSSALPRNEASRLGRPPDEPAAPLLPPDPPVHGPDPTPGP